MTTFEETLKIKFDADIKRFFFTLKDEDTFHLEGIPKEAIITQNFIMKVLDKPTYKVGASWYLTEDFQEGSGDFGDYTYEELKEKFPKFFERKGTISAFKW